MVGGHTDGARQAGTGGSADSGRPLAVLVTDDDPGVRSLVVEHLHGRGMVVHEAATGDDALDALGRLPVDVAVLDVHMPGASGLDVLRRLRADGPEVAVILLTAAGGEVDRVVGLELGADDYVVKPFSVRELEARIRAVVRRAARAEPVEQLVAGDIVIDIGARQVTKSGERVALTPKEFDLLAHLAAHPRRAFTRDELLRKVWGSSASWQQPATVTEHIRRLRNKLEDDPSTPRLLATVRSSGYRFDPPD